MTYKLYFVSNSLTAIPIGRNRFGPENNTWNTNAHAPRSTSKGLAMAVKYGAWCHAKKRQPAESVWHGRPSSISNGVGGESQR